MCRHGAPEGPDDECLSAGGCLLQSADSPHASSSQHADIIPIYSFILENLTSRASHGMITRKKQSTPRISFLPAPYLSWGAARLVEWYTQDPAIGHLTGTEQTLNLLDPKAGGRRQARRFWEGTGLWCAVPGGRQGLSRHVGTVPQGRCPPLPSTGSEAPPTRAPKCGPQVCGLEVKMHGAPSLPRCFSTGVCL